MSITQSTFADVTGSDVSTSNQSTDNIIDATVDGLWTDAEVWQDGEEIVIGCTDDRDVPEPTDGDIIEIGVRGDVLCSPTRDDTPDDIIVAADDAVILD
ncbi:hypothetical protein NDO75_05150 [Natrinema sp. 1APR25-10V2]|nr:hypothetical protein [Natrinema sp. 1APR25-10V2]